MPVGRLMGRNAGFAVDARIRPLVPTEEDGWEGEPVGETVGKIGNAILNRRFRTGYGGKRDVHANVVAPTNDAGGPRRARRV